MNSIATYNVCMCMHCTSIFASLLLICVLCSPSSYYIKKNNTYSSYCILLWDILLIVTWIHVYNCMTRLQVHNTDKPLYCIQMYAVHPYIHINIQYCSTYTNKYVQWSSVGFLVLTVSQQTPHHRRLSAQLYHAHVLSWQKNSNLWFKLFLSFSSSFMVG